MRFLVDECTGPHVVRWLRVNGHDVVSVYEQAPGISDTRVLQLAVAEQRIIITNDKDFGEKIFRERKDHCGVVLLRLSDERVSQKIATLQKLFERSVSLENRFVVATEVQVRIV